jgi:hypothetical protein
MEVGRPGEADYETHTLKGIAQKGAIVNEQGFTLNRVPSSFWDRWLNFSPRSPDGKVIAKEPNKRLPCIARGFVFAHQDVDSVVAHTKAMENVRTGLEPLDPRKMPKGLEPLNRDQ